MKLGRPDFKKSVVNISATFAEFLGCPNDKPILKTLKKELDKGYKNVVFLILDGLGINPININLSKGCLLRSNIKQTLTSVFPSTTATATTSLLTNQYPIEHGWFGWSMYFPELDQVVDIYLSKDSYTGKPIDANFIKTRLPKVPFYKQAKSDYKINLVVPTFWHDDEVNRFEWKTFDEMFANIKNLCSKKNKQFIYAYCDDPDHTMHDFGVSSMQARQVIHELNEGVEKLSKLKDTLIVVTADHGQIDINGYVNIYKDKQIMRCIEHPFVFEPRATGIFVKSGLENTFEKLFKQKYEKDFKLFTKNYLLRHNYFGQKVTTEKIKYLPNYMAVAKNNKILMFDKKSIKFKGHHTGLTKELYVPLIIIKGGDNNGGN